MFEERSGHSSHLPSTGTPGGSTHSGGFPGHCLTVTLKHRLKAHAPGLTPRAVLEKLAAIQMLDVSFPTTDGRRLVMPRYTEPNPEQALLLHQLNLVLPQQPPPRISNTASSAPFSSTPNVVETFGVPSLKIKSFPAANALNCEGWARRTEAEPSLLSLLAL